MRGRLLTSLRSQTGLTCLTRLTSLTCLSSL